MYARMLRKDGDPPPELQGLGPPATHSDIQSRQRAPQEREQVLIRRQVRNERGVFECSGEGKHARVVAVGDGINDAPVLAGADVAVALASGAELAQAASDIVLAGERLDALAGARATARETLAILRQNQRWALGYNLVAVPFAAFGFVPPWLAAIGMSLSSLVVVLNALRIGRRAQPAPAVAVSSRREVAA